MKKAALLVFVFVVSFTSLSAQKIGKPTLDPVEPTAAQKAIINQGIRFHDQGEYDLAIMKYEEVLRASPDCVFALYESALSYYSKKNLEKTIELGYKVVKYKGKTGILGYVLLANSLDDQGKSGDAIRIYLDAIDLLQNDPENAYHLSSLYFNLGVTYSRLQRNTDARQALKKAVEANFSYNSPHYLLGAVYSLQKYKIPAFLASGRLLTLELNSQRSKIAAKIAQETLKPAPKNPDGNISITINMDAPTDEGDFGMYELFLGTMLTVKSEKDKDKSENEIFAAAIDSLLGIIEDDKKLKSTFIGKTYVPFYAELRRKGYSKHFAYLILQQNGNKEAQDWLINSGQSTLDFFEWGKAYKLN